MRTLISLFYFQQVCVKCEVKYSLDIICVILGFFQYLYLTKKKKCRLRQDLNLPRLDASQIPRQLSYGDECSSHRHRSINSLIFVF